jgi:hypothetical protein
MRVSNFVQSFNESDFLGKAALATKHLKPDPDQHLCIPLKPGGKYQSVHFVGYVGCRVGICYVAAGNNRIPLCAFHLYPDGERSFNSFLKASAHPKFAVLAKRQFLEVFDGLIVPDYVNN